MALHVIVGKGRSGRRRPSCSPPGAPRCGCCPAAAAGPPTRSSTGRSTPPTPTRSTAAARGAAALYNAVNPAYHRWATDWPPVAAGAADRGRAHRRRAGHDGQPLRLRPPDRPDDAGQPAGRHRHQGPGAGADVGRRRWPRTRPAGCGSPRPAPRTSSARRCPPTTRTSCASCPRCAAGRRAWVVGDPDAPRGWSYLPDVAATLATLGTDERALGRAWHVPSAVRARSGRRSPTWPRPWARRRPGSAASRGRCCGDRAGRRRSCARSSTSGTSSTGSPT
jgi:hypothetical protein